MIRRALSEWYGISNAFSHRNPAAGVLRAGQDCDGVSAPSTLSKKAVDRTAISINWPPRRSFSGPAIRFARWPRVLQNLSRALSSISGKTSKTTSASIGAGGDESNGDGVYRQSATRHRSKEKFTRWLSFVGFQPSLFLLASSTGIRRRLPSMRGQAVQG